MAKWKKGNTAWKGAKGQGQSDLPTEVPDRFDEGFLDEMDGRARVARTLRERLRALTTDLGGIPNLSYQEQSLCKRIIHLERQVECFEHTLTQGGTVDYSDYYSSVNALSGLFSKLGLKRRAKSITLTDYLKNNKQQSPSPTEASHEHD